MPTGTRGRSSHMSNIRAGLAQAVNTGQLNASHFFFLYLRHCEAAGIARPAAMTAKYMRAAILGILSNQKNYTIYDKNGHAVDHLREMMEGFLTSAAMSSYMVSLTKEGLIDRKMHTGGRKTDQVTLTAAGLKEVGGHPVGPTPGFWLPGYEPSGNYRASTIAPPSQMPATGAGSYSNAALTRLCIRLGCERDEWEHKYEQAISNNDELVQRLIVADEEIRQLRERLANPQLVHSNGSSDTGLRGRLSATEQEALDRLMREIPTG